MNNRSITPLPPADFTPEIGNYRTLQPFRYWCQKVLPLVYDDSLSYYELLCKVVDYLNKTMEDVETLHDDVTNLHTAYEQLQNYVNTYFSTLDVQQEINNKLDVMATDGTLSNLLAPLVQGFSMPTFVNSVSEMTDTTKVYVLTTNGHVYSYKNGAWTDSGYVYGTNNLFFQAGTTVTSSSQLSSLGDALPNRTYLIGINSSDTLPDFPTGATQYGNLITFNHVAGNDAMVQFWFDSNGGMFARNHWGTNWNDWSEFSNTINEVTSYLTDADKAEPNKIYCIVNAENGFPDNFTQGSMLTACYRSNVDGAGELDLLVSTSGSIYTRIKWGNPPTYSAWSSPVYSNDIALYFKPGTTVTSSDQLSSLGDALPNRTYLIGINSSDTLPDFPTGATQYGNLITFNHVAGNDAMVQFWFDSNGGMFARNHWGTNWNDWSDISNKSAIHTGPTITTTSQLASFADAEPNTMYLIGIYNSAESIPDAPTDFYYGALVTMNHISTQNDATIQIWATSKGDIWIRNHWDSRWLPWVHVNQDTLDNWENVPEEPSNLYWCFKSFGIIGDSLASGAEKDPYDSNTWKFPVETRWGQYLKQDSGREVKYFSEGGLTTRTWFSSSNGYPLAEQSTNFCQCYLIGLGENDVNRLGADYLGSISDINDSNPDANGDTYYGNYGKIIQKMKALVPNARFFLMTNPYDETGLRLQYNDAVREIANHFENCYLLDLAKDYASEYNQPGFIASSRIGGHYDASAYLYMGKLIARSMNKVIFNNGSDFYGMWFIPTT